jgi:5'-nucleotidase
MQLRRAVYAILLSLVVLGGACAQEFHLKIIALNDLHGNLQSPGKMRTSPDSPEVPVGGVDYLAGYVEQLKSENPDHIVVSAGDLTGGSPLVSNLFRDEGTIEVANRMGLELNAVGNHEFDRGVRELRRFQHGGCARPTENTCQGAVVGTPVPFEGAKFEYLAANTFDVRTGKTIFPAYAIKSYHGVKVGFIGITLLETPTIVVSTNVAGLRFADEADTINANVRELRRQGIESIVVLIHQGGYQTTKPAPDINACAGDMNGYPIRAIVGRLDDAVDLVISAHSHEAYVCALPNRAGRRIPVTSASSYGRVVSDIDVTIDTKTRDVTAVTARNLLVDRTNPAIKPDAEIARIVDGYTALAAPLVDRVVGAVTADIPKADGPNREFAMGDLIADAQLEATRSPQTGGAQAALVNAGGIRAGLIFASATPGVPDGRVTYGDLFTALPFGNNLVTMTLTGAQIKALLEEQFIGCGQGGDPGDASPVTSRVLQISQGFSYTASKDAAVCHKVDADSIRVGGAPVRQAGRYRVTVNSLLANGGDQFYVLRKGTNRHVGITDIDAVTAYFAKHKVVAPVPTPRIKTVP